MGLQIIIGLKRLDIAKQRLMPDLSPVQRRLLMLGMLRSVVAAAHDADLGPVALATSEPSAPSLARELDVAILSDGDLPWNEGLVHALSAIVPAPSGVLYLAGDVPLVTAADLAELVAAAPARGVCVARARDAGSNALLVTPAGAMRPLFGAPTSSARHASAAADLGLPCRILDIPGLALDVDTIDDARDAGVLERVPGDPDGEAFEAGSRPIPWARAGEE